VHVAVYLNYYRGVLVASANRAGCYGVFRMNTTHFGNVATLWR